MRSFKLFPITGNGAFKAVLATSTRPLIRSLVSPYKSFINCTGLRIPCSIKITTTSVIGRSKSVEITALSSSVTPSSSTILRWDISFWTMPVWLTAVAAKADTSTKRDAEKPSITENLETVPSPVGSSAI